MNLIYDRTQSDIDSALSIRGKYQALGDWSGITADEIEQLKRGTYSCFDDMNRVDAAVRTIGEQLTAAGYPVRYTSPVPQPPPEYTQLSYIESSGAQYIDTGYKPNSNTRVVCKVTGFPITNTNQTLFGSRTGTGATDAFAFLTTTSNYYRTDYGGAIGNYSASVNISGELTVDKNKNVTLLNGANQQTLTVSSFSSTHNLYIAAMNNGGTPNFYTSGVQYNLFQIYDNDILVRDYVPAIKNGDIGMYDKLNGQMYGNSGTGSFVAGDTVEIETEPQKTEFEIGDIITYDIWRIYLDNVQAIRNAYYTMPDTPDLPESTAPLNFGGANAIEKLLYDVQTLYNAMAASYRKCGTFQAGTNTQRLPLQRSVT